MCLPEDDTRAGVFPVHNSVGAYPEDIELRDAVRFEDYRGLMMAEDLMSAGFEKREVFQTKKRFYDISQQFIHLNAYAYKQLYCIDLEDNRNKTNPIIVKQKLKPVMKFKSLLSIQVAN